MLDFSMAQRNKSGALLGLAVILQRVSRPGLGIVQLSGDVETRRKPARNPSEMGEKVPEEGQR
jgi:hypothetical protein